jgi:hypothetical protein
LIDISFFFKYLEWRAVLIGSEFDGEWDIYPQIGPSSLTEIRSWHRYLHKTCLSSWVFKLIRQFNVFNYTFLLVCVDEEVCVWNNLETLLTSASLILFADFINLSIYGIDYQASMHHGRVNPATIMCKPTHHLALHQPYTTILFYFINILQANLTVSTIIILFYYFYYYAFSMQIKWALHPNRS